jgi:DNA repair protein RecO (recombination protein O)
MNETVRGPFFVLRTIDYSETSQVLRLYTERSGKIGAIARGSKRTKGSFQGPFDLFALYDGVWIEKGEGRLDVVISADLREDWRRLREELHALYAASYVAEFIDELTPDGQAQPDLFALAVATLRRLSQSAPVGRAVFQFEARALRILGVFPRLLECGLCGGRVSQTEAYFSLRDGGSICIKCRPRDPGYFTVTTRALYALSYLGSADPSAVESLDPVRDDLRFLLDHYVRHVAERGFKTARFVQEACRA